MNREKQIEEMAEAIFKNCNCGLFFSEAEKIARFVIEEQGYRKIQTTDWLTKGISKEQLEREKDEALKEFCEQNCRKYGYRKQSEVARETIDDFLNAMRQKHEEQRRVYGGALALLLPDIEQIAAELKKKYTEE